MRSCPALHYDPPKRLRAASGVVVQRVAVAGEFGEQLDVKGLAASSALSAITEVHAGGANSGLVGRQRPVGHGRGDVGDGRNPGHSSCPSFVVVCDAVT